MSTFDNFCSIHRIRAEATITDARPPWTDDNEGWAGTAWKVRLRYGGRQMTVPFYQAVRLKKFLGPIYEKTIAASGEY